MVDPISASGASVKFLGIVKDLPLWLLAATGLSLVIFLETPSFRELATVQVQAWLRVSVIIVVILTVCRLAGLLINYLNDRRINSERREIKRFENVYAPLISHFLTLHITSSQAVGAPYFRQRLKNAREILFEVKSPIRAVRSAFRALFDKQIIGPSAEVEYGGCFPLDNIQRIVRENTQFVDDELLNLVAWAGRAQYEDRPEERELTGADYALFQYIWREYSRLNKKYG